MATTGTNRFMEHRGNHLQRLVRPLLALPIAVLLTGWMTGCSSTPPISRAAVTTVVLVGDSLAVEAASYLPPLLGGKSFIPESFAGTAPCDWTGKDLRITNATVVVISFTGNSSTPCMSDGAGGYLSGQAVVDKYRADVTVLVAAARDAGANVIVVGQPIRAGVVPGNDVVVGVNRVYTDLTASMGGVMFLDAGAEVENADGSYAESLPCLPGEAACDPSGSNAIRSNDGLHFCPGPPPTGPCPVYSSGAFRYANAIATRVNTL